MRPARSPSQSRSDCGKNPVELADTIFVWKPPPGTLKIFASDWRYMLPGWHPHVIPHSTLCVEHERDGGGDHNFILPSVTIPTSHLLLSFLFYGLIVVHKVVNMNVMYYFLFLYCQRFVLNSSICSSI
jgi:hypothetical protein